LYNGVRQEDVIRIVDEHILGGKIVRELVQRPGDPKGDGGDSK
jgi:(2Fe-2S) ferredoxin